MSLYNEEQQDYMAYLARPKPEDKAPCGWYRVEECREGRSCCGGCPNAVWKKKL
jgi:hypothetical protein